jgi:hypothetical protein
VLAHNIVVSTDQQVEDFFLQSEAPTSARPESAQELVSEGVKAKSEEHGDFFVTTVGVPDPPHTSDSVQSTTEDAVRVAGGGKIRGLDGRYVPKPGTGKPRRSIGGARVKRGRKCKLIRRVCIPCIFTASNTI